MLGETEIEEQTWIAGDGTDQLFVERDGVGKLPFRHQFFSLARFQRQFIGLSPGLRAEEKNSENKKKRQGQALPLPGNAHLLECQLQTEPDLPLAGSAGDLHEV